MDGVVRTRAGYAGGTAADPTYRSIGDHTECLQVDFDPERVSYGNLIDAFWDMHDPVREAISRQYASLILAHDEEQFAAARAAAEHLADLVGGRLATRVERLDRFYVAEDYHQKYYLRRHRALMNDFVGMFGPDEAALRDSTAAAKANGLVVGDGSRELLDEVIAGVPLSDAGREELIHSWRRHGGAVCAV